ncbi:MAG: hypothetical protein ACFE0O_10910 [Opitutales bacterium]
MELTDEQKDEVRNWVAAGDSLADVQEKLQESFGIAMTYMDVRFLVDDLEVQLADQPDKPAASDQLDESAASPPPQAAESPGDAGQPDGGDDGFADLETVDEGGGGTVSVSVDKLTRPGAVVSGNVTFSDGKSMGWQLDQMGRLGLVPGSDVPEGYQPSPADIQAFQDSLQAELKKQGY